MNQISKMKFDVESDFPTIDAALTPEEVQRLKSLLGFVNVSTDGRRLEIGNRDAKLVISQDGKLHLKGRSITQVARGEYRVDAAVIELN